MNPLMREFLPYIIALCAIVGVLFYVDHLQNKVSKLTTQLVASESSNKKLADGIELQNNKINDLAHAAMQRSIDNAAALKIVQKQADLAVKNAKSILVIPRSTTNICADSESLINKELGL